MRRSRVSDKFNGTGGVPENWAQILGATGDIQDKPQDLSITDSTGQSAGIASTLATSSFDPRGVVTTIVAKSTASIRMATPSSGSSACPRPAR